MGCGLELQGGVLDVEVFVQAGLELVEHGGEVAVVEAGVVNDEVGGEDGESGGDLGGVQVVDVVHVWVGEEPGEDVGEVEALGVASSRTWVVSRSSLRVLAP